MAAKGGVKRKVGDEIEAMCGRCKELRYHTIAALGPDGHVEQVVCNFCHSPHKLRGAGAGGSAAAAAAPRAARRSAREPDDDLAGNARPYAPTGTFDKGDLLQHAKFGRGRVIDVRGDRIDVRLHDGIVRTFVHVGKPGK